MNLNQAQKKDLTSAVAAIGGIGLGVIASELAPPFGGALLLVGVALVLGAAIGRVLDFRHTRHHEQSSEHNHAVHTGTHG
jgi:hypothetical protein